MHDRQLRILRRLGLWTLVCSVSAAPSFLWAVHEFDPLAMVTGIVCFIVLLTAITLTPQFDRFRGIPFMRRTLYIGYGTRVGLSILFPLGMVVDMIPGLISVGIVEKFTFDTDSFIATLATTLIQGTILNIIVGAFILVVWGFQRIFLKLPPVGLVCRRCAYDLRGSLQSDACPECGEPVAASVVKFAA